MISVCAEKQYWKVLLSPTFPLLCDFYRLSMSSLRFSRFSFSTVRGPVRVCVCEWMFGLGWSNLVVFCMGSQWKGSMLAVVV